MQFPIDLEDDVHVVASFEQDYVARLASLLDIDTDLARTALQHCQWNFEASVDAACQLASASSRVE